MKRDLAKYIEHTLLRADATGADIEKLCEEALRFGFAAVCVNPIWVRMAADILAGSPVGVCAVAGFPLGATFPAVKAREASQCISEGASEIDAVMNIGALKGENQQRVVEELSLVVRTCREGGALCKVVLETCFLTDTEKVTACHLAKEIGADFVKTSTGFGPGGATTRDVALMRAAAGPDVGVKAAGGIKDGHTAQAMLQAGATRIGTSAGVQIIQEQPPDSNNPGH